MAAQYDFEKGPPSLRNFPKIETEEIGKLLDRKYPTNDNGSIDYFYLQIRKRFIWKKREINARDEILQALLRLPQEQEWQKVHPGRDWPSIFFGHFPKNPGETERDQEERLNRELRVMLKGELEVKLAQFVNPDVNPAKKPTVHIMITRVCKYTGPDEDYLAAMEIGDNFEDV